MRSLVLKNKWFFLITTLAGWALRGYFLKHYALIEGDTLIYGQIAKNWLGTGTFGLLESGHVMPTLIRLPGYPAFLALIFKVFGLEHYSAVLRIQVVVDLCTCFLIAKLAGTMISDKAAKIAFFLAALCPFTAIYCAAPLAETLSIFVTTLALLAATYALESNSSLLWWTLCGLATGASILLRPDGGILLAALLIYVAWILLRAKGYSPAIDKGRLLAGAVVFTAVALAPLVPWTLRNWSIFHVFEPLAPRYANAPGEFVPMGFNRWMKTWVTEFVSTNDVYWKVSADIPGEEVNFDDIPDRAFDNADERERTRQLVKSYNARLVLTPDLDRQWGQLAAERIRRSRLRYYLWLPLLRVIDMWLRPRTEMLNLDLPWWRFEDLWESTLSIGLGVLNALYLFWAVLGFRRSAGMKYLGLLAGFVVLRSITLATLENPEPRYTLECFPAIIVMAAAGIATMSWRLRSRTNAMVRKSDLIQGPIGHSELCAEVL